MVYAMLWYALATDNLRTCYEIVSYGMINKMPWYKI